ncbi:hypothetical protein GFC01_04100 [Desulfofundulus thermobenzoicus]|uniref:HEPN AbiU2-like domain-containing protein n=1 Tax=Desulfofundulus thermobenzoicus TaxID=29376 RepID=A0A6N7IPF2_9FIRM|nr:hypothetical protein [Desulfofundulus thermobenzoicus]MQL51457.1 hypothetical protein [Desulfofundulus thermobenzoicus]
MNGILQILAFINDYSQKLIGKYFIVELNSLFNLLSKLTEYNTKYKSLEHKELLSEITKLENKFNFRYIRNKVAAHKDSNIDLKSYADMWNSINFSSLNEYWRVFVNHIDKILTKYYPIEKKLYFLIQRETIAGAIATEDKKDAYKPFYDILV